MSRVTTGVRALICAAHRSADGVMHGHTWTVVAWWPEGQRAEALLDRLRMCLARYDHDILPDALSSGEALARSIGEHLAKCVAVDVSREAEGIFARWEA